MLEADPSDIVVPLILFRYTTSNGGFSCKASLDGFFRLDDPHDNEHIKNGCRLALAATVFDGLSWYPLEYLSSN